MSVLTDKNILIIGDETRQIVQLEKTFREQGMNVHVTQCGTTTRRELEEKNIDIVLLNHLHEGDTCTQLLLSLRDTEFAKELPIFALVESKPDDISHALMLGAADYVTTDESISSIIHKMKQIFGHPDNYASDKFFKVPADRTVYKKTGVRVYIVEDDPLLRNLLDAKFDSLKFPHEFSIDGTDVLAKMIQFKPQVIVLDLMLPVRHGFEILKDLKHNPLLKEVPVIIFSNQDSQEDKHTVFELGADRFYVKAMTDLSELVLSIEELAL